MRPLIHPVQVHCDGVSALGLTKHTHLTFSDLKNEFKKAYGYDYITVANFWSLIKVPMPGVALKHLFWTLFFQKNPMSIPRLKGIFKIQDTSDDMVLAWTIMIAYAIREAGAQPRQFLVPAKVWKPSLEGTCQEQQEGKAANPKEITAEDDEPKKPMAKEPNLKRKHSAIDLTVEESEPE